MRSTQEATRLLPTVIVAHHDTADEYDSVVDADLAGVALVVDHLVALGHRHISLVGYDNTLAASAPHQLDQRRAVHDMGATAARLL